MRTVVWSDCPVPCERSSEQSILPLSWNPRRSELGEVELPELRPHLTVCVLTLRTGT